MNLLRLFRRLFPPVQEARCSNCGLLLRERRRRPCPVCGDTRRTLIRGFDNVVRSRDDFS